MRYRLKCLTPLLVGDGRKLSPIDYMVWKDHVNVLDQWRIFRLLAKGPRLESYLEQLKKAPGYLNMTEDLGALVNMIRSRWDVIKDNSGIKPAELDEAEKLYEQITTAYGERQQIQQKVLASQQDRQRAYTLLLKAYDDARRAISYLRWNAGDVETIAPSLWAGRGSRGGSSRTRMPASKSR